MRTPSCDTHTERNAERQKGVCWAGLCAGDSQRASLSLFHTHTGPRKNSPRVWEQKKHQACRDCDAAITGYACLRGRQWHRGTFIKIQAHIHIERLAPWGSSPPRSTICKQDRKSPSRQLYPRRSTFCVRSVHKSRKRKEGCSIIYAQRNYHQAPAIKFLCQHLLQWGNAPESMFARSVPRVNALVANGVYWC